MFYNDKTYHLLMMFQNYQFIKCNKFGIGIMLKLKNNCGNTFQCIKQKQNNKKNTFIKINIT